MFLKHLFLEMSMINTNPMNKHLLSSAVFAYRSAIEGVIAACELKLSEGDGRLMDEAVRGISFAENYFRGVPAVKTEFERILGQPINIGSIRADAEKVGRQSSNPGAVRKIMGDYLSKMTYLQLRVEG